MVILENSHELDKFRGLSTRFYAPAKTCTLFGFPGKKGTYIPAPLRWTFRQENNSHFLGSG